MISAGGLARVVEADDDGAAGDGGADVGAGEETGAVVEDENVEAGGCRLAELGGVEDGFDGQAGHVIVEVAAQLGGPAGPAGHQPHSHVGRHPAAAFVADGLV